MSDELGRPRRIMRGPTHSVPAPGAPVPVPAAQVDAQPNAGDLFDEELAAKFAADILAGSTTVESLHERIDAHVFRPDTVASIREGIRRATGGP